MTLPRSLPRPASRFGVPLTIGVAWILAAALPRVRPGVPAGLVVNLVFFCITGLVAFDCWRRARARPDEATGWRLLTAFFALLTVQAVPAVLSASLRDRPAPFPAPFDWLGIATYPLFWLALLSWDSRPRSARSWAAIVLDCLLFGLSGFSLLLAGGLGEELTRSSGMLVRALFFASNFGGSTLTLALIVSIGLRSRGVWRGPMGWFGGALLGAMLVNLVSVRLGLVGSYYMGHPIDTFVIPAMGMAWMATRSAAPARLPRRADEHTAPSRPALLVPQLIPAAAVLASILTWLRTPEHHLLASASGVGIAVLLVARQTLLVEELHDLSHSLERKVEERTAELERAHEALVRSERMEAVGRLAGSVAHDFNNLLTVILGHAEIGLRERDAEARATELRGITATCQQAARLVRQLLTFARRQKVDAQVVDLNRVLADATPILSRLAGERVAFEGAASPAPAWVWADPSQLEQLLTNLTANARDAMPRGGRLTVRVSPAHAEHRVVLEVEDTGEGIPPEVLPHIFEPFFTTKGSERGSGLGLATCYGIVARAGGRISAGARDGGGTVFRIELPEANGRGA